MDALIIEGNGASYNDLRRANIDQMGLVAAMTDNDEVNLMACRIAKNVASPLPSPACAMPNIQMPILF